MIALCFEIKTVLFLDVNIYFTENILFHIYVPGK